MQLNRENQFQRDKVKQRLLKTAAELWGYDEIELEELDPLVDLLFGACAVQFEKTARELHQSRTRTLKQLASLLLPEALTIPTPAHAVLHVRPLEPQQIITTEQQFIASQEVVNPDNLAKPEKKDVFFSPALNTTLVNGDVRYLAFGRKLLQTAGVLPREVLLSASDKASALPTQSLWVGLEFPSKLSSIDDLTFYFDWKNQPDAAYYRSLLPSTQWFLDGQPIRTRSGYAPVKVRHRTDTNEWQDQLPNVSEVLEQQALQSYQTSFITVNQLTGLASSTPYPTVFSSVFDTESLATLPKTITWIEVRFPQLMPAEVLSNTVCAINCLPVTNRRLIRSNRPYRVGKLLNIIPLPTTDYFLTIRQVTTDSGVAYRNVPFQRFKTLEPNTYAIREEGVSRFDQRNATEFSNHLLDLIRDENAAFEALGSSRVVQDIKAIKQLISRLERQIAASTKNPDVEHYLALNAERDENVWVEFWSTLGATANRLPSGTKLQPYKSNDFQANDLLLVTPSHGGRDKPSDTEKVHSFRSALLSRDRLVTEEDMKAACYARLGDLIDSVTFGKGVRVLPRSNQALERTLDITIRLTTDAKMTEAELESTERDLQQFIHQRSSTVLPIQVILKNEQ
ncbi:type VI secretion system baseplate subunit TssF [Tunicatimonas pelagia]|uniref:type VI secretion system baseplate subunit TssF n=1 Tax=Tunicatimonas pelagia TaxID=931531 RepID=UPI002665B4B9|nr:type VI secretion system baseplate subunit TssF [Tunicatimonas pelagia]WKN41293.1 type VI secretion system baseplate subunit TssF [Tunicatimonas pelagia]